MPRKREVSIDTVRAVTTTLIEQGVRPSVRVVQAQTKGGSVTVRSYLREIDALGMWERWLKGEKDKSRADGGAAPSAANWGDLVSSVDQLKKELADVRAEIAALRSAAPLDGTRDQSPPIRTLSKDHPLYGLSIRDAVTKQLEIIGEPSTARQVTVALEEAGYVIIKKDRDGAVHQGLRRAQRSGKVILVSRGKWALKKWYPDEHTQGIEEGDVTVATRDVEHHRQQVLAAQRASRDIGVKFGRLTFEELYSFDRISQLRNLINQGVRPEEAIKTVGMPLGTFKKYRTAIIEVEKYPTAALFYAAAENIRLAWRT